MAKPVIVVAYDEQRNIGKNGDLPWPKIPEDMKQFKERTGGHVVIMGRKTYESIPSKYKPLPNRINIVVTHTPPREIAKNYSDGLVNPVYADSLYDAIMLAGNICSYMKLDQYFIIGGAEIYNRAVNVSYGSSEIIASEIKGVYDGDCKFPELKGQWNRELLGAYEKFDVVKYTEVK